MSPKGQVWKTFTTDGSGNALVDVAVPVPYITGRLYSDADQNLAFSAGDSAYTNVTLQIKFANGTVYRMLPTDTNGQFAFLPEFGAPNTTLTVIEPSTGQQLANITLDGVGSGHANLPVAPAHISGRIFFDLNSDSSYSAGTDVPYGPGQSLELHRKDGSLFSIATIGADGSFVLATDPPAPNTLFDIVAAADPSVVLAANVGTDRLGFGVKQIPLAPSHIIATVWWDVNEDGTYGSGDTFMANEAIELLKSDGTVYATGTTLTNGTVVINPTNPAPFETLTVVRAADPANVLETLVTDARGNGQVQIKLIPGHFAGEAFWDLNKDGVQDSGEPAFANTYLDFVWPNGSSFHRFTTAANGTFGYKTIVYANQNFDVILPNGVNVQTVTTDNAGDAVSISIPIQPAVLSANLWFDYLSNGVLDANDDKPVANLPLVFKFANGSTYATVTTDGNGAFSYTAALALSAVAPNTNIQIVDPTNANVLGAIATDNFGSGHVDVALPPPPPVLTGAIVFDMNRDGSRDSSDVPYLASKQVVLLFGNGSVYMNGSVVADGNFTFLVTDPQPGETFAMISPLDPAQGLGTITADQYGASNQDVLLQPSRITGVVFYDVTQDGLFSGPPDIPAEGEHLVLKLANGTIYGNISTAPDGSFVFDPLHPLPTTNFTIVRSTALNVILGAVFTDPLGNGNAEVPLVPAEIQGVLFYDTNKNGVHDAGETPVNDTLISIAMPNGTELTGSPVLTNSTGGFSLLTVPHPSAVLNLVLPSGYVLKNFTTTNTGAATVVGPLAVPYISLHVWTDYLSNRTFDAGFDEPIINKTLNLVLPNGTVYAQLTTDQAGNASYLAPLADVLPGQTLDIVNPDDSSVWGNITLDRWGAGHQQVPVPAPVPTISGVMFWVSLIAGHGSPRFL